MKIQRIGLNPNYYNLNSANINKHNDNNRYEQPAYTTSPMYHDLAFQARVDKGLVRFYEVNADKMPKTLRAYIEKLADKTMQTPLQAVAAAFAALAGLTSVNEIKEAFPDEELFNDLKDAKDSKATRGILGTYRENKDLLDMDNRSILASKEDLTVWLVKKIFLESKTIDEINNDFKNEIDKDFKDFYEDKELSEDPIRTSTLKALGIKMPEMEYMQSLRYTRDGYSDLIGEKISEAQRLFWESMPIKERTARARKSVEKFEKWWKSLTIDEKLEMIANQTNELEMLKEFNSSEIGKKGLKKYTPAQNTTPTATNTKTKVTSEFSRDDLFKLWAKNNLKIFEANLTEFDKQRLKIIRIQKRIEAWDAMSPEEKTEYINNLRTASEEFRYALISAWNENPDILAALSKTMTKNHIEKPADVLYKSEAFNQYMSESMTSFWSQRPEFAKKFGASLKSAYAEIKNAVASGKFLQMKMEIMRNRDNRIKETLEEVKSYKSVVHDEEYDKYPDYMKDFIDAYCNNKDVKLSLIPMQYLKDFFKTVNEILTPDEVNSWTKYIKYEDLDLNDKLNIRKIQYDNYPKMDKINTALEATIAEIVYNCTGESAVYLLNANDLMEAIKQISDGKKVLEIKDSESPKVFRTPIKTNSININKINELYTKFSKPLGNFDIYTIVERFFEIDPNKTNNREKIENTMNMLCKQIDKFGKSCEILFSDENSYPLDIRLAFLDKFKRNLPKDNDKYVYNILLNDIDDLKKEDIIKTIDGHVRRKYSFLPDYMLKLYIYEWNRILRNDKISELNRTEASLRRSFNYKENDLITYTIDRKAMNSANHLDILCMEQALADVLYESTGIAKFYAFTFEELIDTIQSLCVLKKFPTPPIPIYSSTVMDCFDVIVKKKINTNKLSRLMDEYIEEILKYLEETNEAKKPIDRKELLYTLNPKENLDLVDKYTQMRIDNVYEYLNR